MQEPIRVAYTVEQCWHRVPGGTAVAALRVAEAMADVPGAQLTMVAGRHRRPARRQWMPPGEVSQLPVPYPLLYETWLYAGWPRVETATGPVDVAHATTLIPCPTRLPLLVTLHDLAFLHHPDHFTAHGLRIFRRSLAMIKRRADLVLCSSQATMDDCLASGISADRLRLVPLGVEVQAARTSDIVRVRARYDLPERFVLFVGTVEPRKNLGRLADAVRRVGTRMPLVVAGASGWGDVTLDPEIDVRFLGFVPDDDLRGLYASSSVFAYPSLMEGYGLPVLEAMAQGAAVVTSAGHSTEEVAGGAAVLVDPLSVDDIARGIVDAITRKETLARLGRQRASRASWVVTAALTLDAYRELAG